MEKWKQADKKIEQRLDTLDQWEGVARNAEDTTKEKWVGMVDFEHVRKGIIGRPFCWSRKYVNFGKSVASLRLARIFNRYRFDPQRGRHLAHEHPSELVKPILYVRNEKRLVKPTIYTNYP